MKTTRIFILRSSLFALATLLLAFSGTRVNAQTADAQSSTAQAASAATGVPVIKPVARITQAIDEAKLAPVQARVHPLARPEFDRGVVPDSQPMNRMMLVLKRSPEQQAALTELMNEQQTKNSPNYHAWLTPTTFGQQFGIADVDVQTVTNWLAQKGFTGIKVSPSNMFVEFSGTAGNVRNAFHTEIHQFMVKGEMHIANTSVPQIPAALSPVVSGIHSLHTFRKKSFMHFSKALEKAKAKAAAEGTNFTFANVCPDPPNGNQPCAALAPGDFAKIYNLPSGLDGTGQTIALVARSNVVTSDITQFGQAFGLTNLTNFSQANNVVLTGPDPGLALGDQDEATLDVEWSGAVAPGAKILLVPSDNQGSTAIDGVDLSSFFIVQNNLAQIMSQSFGACEAVSNDGFEGTLWEQAAAQGITVMVSTGDTGSASCDPDQFSGNFADASDAGLAVSGSASTPFNVAVGGTDFDDATNPSTYWNTTNSGTGLASAKSYIPEITWNGGCASAATPANLNTVCTGIANDLDTTSADLTGGGGGASNCAFNTVNGDGSVTCAGGYAKPAWQQLAGLTGMPADTVRDIPDVSLFAAVNTASNHFVIICEASSPLQNGQPCSLTPPLNFSGVGGTSASSPAFAGIVALVNQSEVNAGRLKAGEGQGNINYVLYKLAVAQYANASLNCNSSTGPNAGCTFNDVTKGNISVPCVGNFSSDFPNLFDSFTTPNCSTTATNAIGVLVETSSTTTPGWTTTTGYDLATGLGSVNVSNLVSNWGNVTANYKPSTATVTSTAPASLTSPALAHGANATFNVSVTSASGTPTGDISLIVPAADPFASNATGINAATLSNGTAQIVTNQLPGGTYQVTIHYAGDGTFAPSDSGPVTVTINKENSASTTTMWSDLNFPNNGMQITTSPYGGPYLFRVDVVGSNGNDVTPCTATAANVFIPCPTGNVTFTADGNPLNDFINSKTGTATNVGLLNPLGFVEDRYLGSTGLPVGSHSVVASYAGDNSYNSSLASPLSVSITKGTTQTAVAPTANGQAATAFAIGQTVTLNGQVLTFNPAFNGPSSGAGPTGSITFSSCGTATSCTAALTPTAASNSGGALATAALQTTFTAAGVQNITATYPGDTNYNGCTTANTTPPADCILNAAGFVVASKLAFTVQPSNVATGTSIAPAIQVAIQDASGNTVTGATSPINVPVTIAIGTNPGSGTLGGTFTVNAVNGVATFANLTISSAGTGYTLVASTPNLTSATSTAFNVGTVGSFTVSYPAQPTTLNSSTGAAAGTTITVTPSGGFTGNVAVTATAATLPPGVSCTNSPLTINVTGTTAVTGTLNCQVTASSTTLSAANIIHTEMLEAKAAPLAAPAPPNNGGAAWWALSAGSGFAALFLFFLPRGGRKRLHAALGLGLICILSLTLGCSGGYNGGGGAVTTTTTMKVNADKEAAGTAFTFSVTVTGGTPTGMAQLFDGGTAISTAGASAAVSGGAASLTWTPTAAASGTHAISVHYLGDTKTMASQSGTLNLTVQGSTTIAVTTSPAATPAAGPINITVN